MFKNKKRLQQIEKLKEILNKEKEEIITIENELNESMPKINISNLYLVRERGVFRIGILKLKSTIDYQGEIEYFATMKDLFNNNLIFKKCGRTEHKEFVFDKSLEETHYVYLEPGLMSSF